MGRSGDRSGSSSRRPGAASRRARCRTGRWAKALVDQALQPSWLLAAEDGALTIPQLATPLLVATVAAVVLWMLALLGAAFATRARGVDPGPATMELGEEPPAVVDLLSNDWRVTADA